MSLEIVSNTLLILCAGCYQDHLNWFQDRLKILGNQHLPYIQYGRNNINSLTTLYVYMFQLIALLDLYVSVVGHFIWFMFQLIQMKDK